MISQAVAENGLTYLIDKSSNRNCHDALGRAKHDLEAVPVVTAVFTDDSGGSSRTPKINNLFAINVGAALDDE
jgi:hypothetical protein